MTNKGKPVATGGGVVATGTKLRAKDNQNIESSQSKIAPGTALTAFLKRYRFDLLTLAPDKHILQLLDCVNCLLAEVEEAQYGR